MAERCTGLNALALSGTKACKCCTKGSREGALRFEQLVVDLISEIVASTGKQEDTTDIYVDPRLAGLVVGPGKITAPMPDPVILRAPTADYVPAVGAILLIAGQVAHQLARSDAVLDALGTILGTLRALGQKSRDYAESRCRQCCILSAWGKGSIRQTVHGTFRRRAK